MRSRSPRKGFPPETQLVVEIFVRKLSRSKRFYRKLGFRLIRESPGFAVLGWDQSRLFLEERPDLRTGMSLPAANVRILVPDVDRCWSRVPEWTTRILAPIADRDYGLRDFTVLDPDGFGIRFASPRSPGHTDDF